MKRIALAVCLASLSQIGTAQDLVISNARIIDGTDRVIASGSIVVENGRISTVTAGNVDAGDRRLIDARGMTAMPGYIDAHRHIIRGDPDQWMHDTAADNMREFLESGFTTVLSAGDPLDHILELRRLTAVGEIKGPRILAAGRVPLAAAGPGHLASTRRASITRAPRIARPRPRLPCPRTRRANRYEAWLKPASMPLKR